MSRSAAPAAVGQAMARLAQERPGDAARLREDPGLARAAVTVMAASRSLTRLLMTDPVAIDVLAALDLRPAVPGGDEGGDEGGDGGGGDGGGRGEAALVAWKRRELLRIAARDLLGLDGLAVVGAALAAMARDVLEAACALAGVGPRPGSGPGSGGGPGPGGGALAVIGMGKLGGRELNYASDIDVLFAGEADPLAVMAIARQCFRVDTNLRPEGRSGRLILPLASYEAYWDRWARPWEFQALLKARPVAGDPVLGAAFDEAAARRVWGRPFGVDELRELRSMKARAEDAVAAKGLAEREVKRGRGGIRDAEFAVQILQLVHGRQDPGLRSPTTLLALAELAAGGYVSGDDARTLEDGYIFLRTVEHRLQLEDEQQVHAVPANPEARSRLARVMGYRDGPRSTALADFDADLRRHQAAVRSVHEQLYFRPLLEAFSAGRAAPAGAGGRAGGTAIPPEAIDQRLAVFGFADADRTRRRVQGLTRGLSRSSRLMSQMLPLILDWLSKSPDPDLGLLGLSTLVAHGGGLPALVATFRESPEAARRVCLLLGTGRLFLRRLEQFPELLEDLADAAALRPRRREDLLVAAERALGWRSGSAPRQEALQRLKQAREVRLAAADVLGLADVRATATALSELAEAVLQAAMDTVGPSVPMAVVAMGRFGGGELSYASDLDVLLVSATPGDFEQANAAAGTLLRIAQGATPAAGIYQLDLGLRPEGRQGPLVRSLEDHLAYYQRWGQTWERQALVRARPVAGDAALGEAFMDAVAPWVWGGLSDEDVREIRRMKARVERERIPVREDPQFHLKLGKGSLSDVEWTVQLLQLRFGVRAPGTLAALGLLEDAGWVPAEDARALRDSYRFCEHTRNRLFLIKASGGVTGGGAGGSGADALPAEPEVLARLARSLDTTAGDLREQFRRVTRRARAVMERLFYGQEP